MQPQKGPEPCCRPLMGYYSMHRKTRSRVLELLETARP